MYTLGVFIQAYIHTCTLGVFIQAYTHLVCLYRLTHTY